MRPKAFFKDTYKQTEILQQTIVIPSNFISKAIIKTNTNNNSTPKICEKIQN